MDRHQRNVFEVFHAEGSDDEFDEFSDGQDNDFALRNRNGTDSALQVKLKEMIDEP